MLSYIVNNNNNIRIMLPLPFTISLLFLSVAFLTSKLQYRSTYLLISLYSLLGPIETASLLLCTLSFASNDYAQSIVSALLICALAGIGLLNVLGFVVQSGYLMLDVKFKRWANRKAKQESCPSNLIWFHIVSFLSLITNYKLKMVLFSRLFNFECFKFQLQHIDKFKIFNVLSFVGYFPQILGLYCCVMVLLYENVDLQRQLMFVDCLAMVVLNMIFSIAIIKKDGDFFHDEIEGVKLNKVYNAVEEISSTTALERVGRVGKGKLSLQDISEVEQFAYTSTKRDRNKRKNHSKSREVKGSRQSFYVQANSSQKTGSRIQSEAQSSQRKHSNEAVVGAGDVSKVENTIEVDQLYQQSTSVDQDKLVQKDDGWNNSHVIQSQIPLKCPPFNVRPIQLVSNTVSLVIGGKEQEGQGEICHTKLSDYLLSLQAQMKFEVVQEQIPSAVEQSDNTLTNFILVDSSAILDNEQPSIIQPPPPSIHQKRMAKSIVSRVMSAHHSPNKYIKKDAQDESDTIFTTKPITEATLNEQHDEQPIKKRSIDKNKRHSNHPINSASSAHRIHPISFKQRLRQQDKSRMEVELAERKQLLRRRLQLKREEYENTMVEDEQNQNNFYQQFLHSKQESSKQFKRTAPQSLALFAKKKHQNQSSIIAENYSTDNIPRQPRAIINLIEHQQPSQPTFILSRAFDRKKAIKFSSKSRLRPQTVKNNRARQVSLESKGSSSSTMGKKMNSLQKIYLQKLYNQ